jgi:predicted extracellular nuclease
VSDQPVTGRSRLPWKARLGVLLILGGLVPLASPAAVGAVSPDLVISEVYGGGGNTGAVYTNDFVEIFNRGTAAVPLTGKSIQYASASGTGNFGTNPVTPLSGSLEAGQYYLVRLAAGTIASGTLPDEDASGTVNMAGTGGKVALVNSTTGLACNGSTDTCDASELALIIDLVGYGGATFYETAPTAATTNSTSAQRISGGCVDTDNNAADFTVGTPTPRNTLSTRNPCAGDGAPAVASSTPANNATNVALNAPITVTFSEAVTAPAGAFALVCDGAAKTFTLSGGPTTFTLTPTTAFAEGDVCTVTVTAAQVADTDTADPPDTMAANHSFSFTAVDPEACGDPATRIHQIQGTGAVSGMIGRTVSIEGVVVGDYQGSGQFSGYHIQEENSDVDTNPLTSEALFVFNTSFPVNVGDQVRVTGTVAEFPTSSTTSQTQLTNVTARLSCDEEVGVAATVVTLPVESLTVWERYESMLITIPQQLTVSETFNLGRFGELVLSIDGRQWIPTHLVEPGAEAIALQSLNDRSRIILDDASNLQNLDPTRYPDGAGGLSATNTLRVGDTLDGALTGVLEQRFNVYRVQPIDPSLLTFSSTNPRPTAPEPVGGNVQVAAMNVLNYFDTLDTNPGSGNGPNICGPLMNQECRGANTAFELERQRAKIVAALLGLDADIVGLMEIENDSGSATADLVNALNAATAPGTWDYIRTGTIGGDAIKLAIIYKPGVVTPVGDFEILDSSDDPRFIDTLNRPSLAQTFEEVGGGGRFTVVVNHLKSKGSACPGDPDIGDGQGNCNITRTMAAEALVDWIATDPTGSGDRDYLVIGDLNSYANEDPIDVFVEAGYINLLDEFMGDEAYSYVFMGQTGYLDHALASPTLAAQVTGATEWHINADEPTVLDYNTDFKSPNHVNTLYAPTPYRSSDHDPLLVGLDLLDFDFGGFERPVDDRPAVNVGNSGSAIPLKFSLGGDQGLDIFFGAPVSWKINCASRAAEDAAEALVLAGGSQLQYDPASDTYTLVWKTDAGWANSCRTVELAFADGTYAFADFRFRK